MPSSWTPPLIPPRHPRAFRRASENFAFLQLFLAFQLIFNMPKRRPKISEISDAQKPGKIWKIRTRSAKISRFYVFFMTFRRPKTMKNRERLKPYILKEASSDMLAEPPIFASISHQNFMFFHVFSGTAPRPHFFSFFPEFYQKSAILGPLGAQLGSQMATKIRQIPEKT